MAIHIQRREFISTLVGGAAAASPIVACADSGKVARIGYLSPDSPHQPLQLFLMPFVMGYESWDGLKEKMSPSSSAMRRIGSSGCPKSQQGWCASMSTS